jgi:phage terminase small subunit
MKKIKEPKGLGTAGRRYWKQSMVEVDFEEVHDLERLLMAAKCLDDLSEAESRVKADGMFMTNRYGNVVEHPAVKTIRDTRLLFVKIVRELGLDLDPPTDSRPPRQY